MLFALLLLRAFITAYSQKEPINTTHTYQVDSTLSSVSSLRSGARPAGDKVNLTIIGLFPLSGQWHGGKAMLPAVQLALEHINSREDILENYNLQLMWGDTACDAGVGVNSMYELLYAPPVKLMVLGAGCSPVTETTAQASHLWNLVQVSYVSASPALSNKKRFPMFFRVGASELALNPTKIEMMKYFGWTKVATIHESIELFSLVKWPAENYFWNLVNEDFVRMFEENNITLITSEVFTDDPTVQVANLKHHDARIIFAGAHYAALYRLMCAAYQAGMYGSRYVWVLPGWYQSGWWTDAVYDGSTDCTAAEIQLASEGYMGLGTVYINPHQVMGISGLTPDMWEAEMANTTDYPNLDGSYVAAQGYDAAWAVALALNFTDSELQRKGVEYGLEAFTYNNTELTDLVLANMWKVDFQGIKGRIFYDENGDCLDNVQILRFQENALPVVAYYQPATEEGIQWLPETPIIWKDGRPPKDSTRKVINYLFVPDTMYGIMVTIAAVGSATALSLLIFNVIFRNERLIKMSSPVLNNIILVGCIISYSTVVFQERATDSTYILCKVRSFTVMVGFSMTFGALFAKTWRVYVIFTNKTKRTVLRDIQLVGIVTALILLDMILFVSQAIADPHSVVDTVVSTREEDNGDLVIYDTVSLCISSRSLYFMAVNYTIKGLMLVFGAFLAWQTRKVNIPALNDSKYIGMCIYNVVILSLMAVLLAFVLNQQVALQYLLVNILLVLGVSITQLTIFIPKIYKFWYIRTAVGGGADTEAEETGTSFAVQTTHTTNATPAGECQNPKCQTTIKALHAENEKLKAKTG